MRTTVPPAPALLRTLALLAAAVLLGACASPVGQSPASYDLGPLPAAPAASTAAAPAALVVANLSGPAALDSLQMHYRLLYADAQQSRHYAYHHWSGTPLQLLGQRLKGRAAQAGIKVLAPGDAAASLPLLRIEVDEFAQHFDSASRSNGTISLRATVLRGHRLLDQRSFSASRAATSADAAGGARALAEAADAVSDELLRWLASAAPASP